MIANTIQARFGVGDRVWFRVGKLASGTVTHIEPAERSRDGRTRFYVRTDRGQRVLFRSHLVRRMTLAERQAGKWIDTSGDADRQ